MKHAIQAVAVALLCLVALPMFALEQRFVDDVIRMTKAGVPEETILSFIDTRSEKFEVSADDIIHLTEAGVSPKVVQTLVDRAKVTAERREAREDDDRDTGRTVVVAGYPGYPYWGPVWDPWWWGPRLSVSIGHVWGGWGRGGHHGGGNHGGGHHGGGRGGRH